MQEILSVQCISAFLKEYSGIGFCQDMLSFMEKHEDEHDVCEEEDLELSQIETVEC